MKETIKKENGFSCWICNSSKLKLIKNSNIKRTLTSNNFTITDSSYGITSDIFQCKNCGFLQCPRMNDIIHFYEDLVDKNYEETRDSRKIQMKKILNVVRGYKSNCNLLDIGAGSGILIEEALKIGYKAEGIEPSKWLYEEAFKRDLPVHLGTLNNPKLNKLYDVITLIDVIEHVSHPIQLLNKINQITTNDGIVVVVTPDVDSCIAKLMGWSWWHFRVAHIGYFNTKTLNIAFGKAGFQLIKLHRPSWYFTGKYIVDRVNKYIPGICSLKILSYFKNITMPVNLLDSILGVYRKNES